MEQKRTPESTGTAIMDDIMRRFNQTNDEMEVSGLMYGINIGLEMVSNYIINNCPNFHPGTLAVAQLMNKASKALIESMQHNIFTSDEPAEVRFQRVRYIASMFMEIPTLLEKSSDEIWEIIQTHAHSSVLDSDPMSTLDTGIPSSNLVH